MNVKYLDDVTKYVECNDETFHSLIPTVNYDFLINDFFLTLQYTDGFIDTEE